jgi:hypothetical protein
MVGDGDAVGVTAEIVEHILGAAEGWFGVDHPVFAKQRSQPGGEEFGLRELYEARGREDGHEQEDWLRAEEEITGRKARTATV